MNKTSRWRRFCDFCLKKMGWTYTSGVAPEKKCILAGAPHTSIWDFVVAMMFYQAVGGDCLCMVKEEFFKIPGLAWIVRKLGGIPVNQKNPGSVVLSVLHEMEKREKFHLAIAIEGTRKPVKRWKSGYHLIAKAANIPVYLCIFDWGHKRIGLLDKVELTDDAKADTARIQKMFEDMHLIGKHPERYVTH